MFIEEWPLFRGWSIFGGGLLHRFDCITELYFDNFILKSSKYNFTPCRSYNTNIINACNFQWNTCMYTQSKQKNCTW